MKKKNFINNIINGIANAIANDLWKIIKFIIIATIIYIIYKYNS